MYQIKLDNHTGTELLIHDARVAEQGYVVLEPSCSLEEGTAGALSFGIIPSHPYYNDIHKLTSEISLYEDGEWIFTGRVLNDKIGFDNIKQITVEGELSYLLDSVQPYAEYHDISVFNYFSTLLNIHNAQVNEWKRFSVGVVTVTDSNDSLYRFSNYESTSDVIDDKLVQRLGGFLRTRHVNGVRYIDYLSESPSVCSQTIAFGVNLRDFTRHVMGEEVATVLVPLGAKLGENSDERLTVASLNNSSIFIEDEEAISLYGRIVATQTWDDVKTESALLAKGRAELEKRKLLSITIEVSAIDLHAIDPSIESIRLSDTIRIISKPNNIAGIDLPVTKINIDISNAGNTTYVIGKTLRSLTDKSNAYNSKTNIKKVVESYGYGQKITNNYTVVNQVNRNFSLFKESFDNAEYITAEDLGAIKQLPSVTVSDNGKTLQVVNGNWALVTLQSGGTTHARLPSEYQEVMYIGASGTQYIDTGINAESETGCEVSFYLPTSQKDVSIIGARTADTRMYLVHIYPRRFCFGYGNYFSGTHDVTVNATYEITSNLSVGSQNLLVGETVEVAQNISEHKNIHLNYYIFATNNNGSASYNSSAVLFSCKIYSNGILVRDFVPCVKNQTNEVGLYDLVSETFFNNAGSGNFTRGPNI